MVGLLSGASWGRIFSRVWPSYEQNVSDLDRSMHISLWVKVAHSSFIEGSHTTKNTASEGSKLHPQVLDLAGNAYQGPSSLFCLPRDEKKCDDIRHLNDGLANGWVCAILDDLKKMTFYSEKSVWLISLLFSVSEVYIKSRIDKYWPLLTICSTF
jgi:hypothetical protein